MTFSTEDLSDIEATIVTATVGVGVGANGVGASIGVAVALNHIGFNADGTQNDLQVKAYALNSSVQATSAYTLTSLSHQTINAVVVAGSVAVAGGADGSGALSGSGVFTRNYVAVDAQAYHDGDGTGTGIHAASITFNATDTSTITATAAAVSLSAALDGTAAVSLSLGLSIAMNTIANDVEAYIANVVHGATSSTGAISLTTSESASITAVSAAASLAAAGSLGVGVAISGAGAEATNVIVGKDNAYVTASNLNSATSIAIGTTDTSTIDAKIIAASVSLGIGVDGAVGASIGVAVARELHRTTTPTAPRTTSRSKPTR